MTTGTALGLALIAVVVLCAVLFLLIAERRFRARHTEGRALPVTPDRYRVGMPTKKRGANGSHRRAS